MQSSLRETLDDREPNEGSCENVIEGLIRPVVCQEGDGIVLKAKVETMRPIYTVTAPRFSIVTETTFGILLILDG